MSFTTQAKKLFCYHALGLAFIVMCACPGLVHAQSAPAFLNGSSLQSVNAVDALPQWNRVLSLYNEKQLSYLECEEAPFTCASEAVGHWQKFIRDVRSDPAMRQIMTVNAWFNQLPYKQDNWIYGAEDHWASMDEFLEHSGDCEDYAMAKYLTLRELGLPAEKMWIATAYDVYSGTDHAFLIVDFDGQILVLDNRQDSINPRDHSARYKPHYLFNEKNVWIYDEPVMASTVRHDQEEILPGNR